MNDNSVDLTSNSPCANNLLQALCQLLTQSRQKLQQTVNSTMVQTYWQVGRLIVEDEQQGKQRAQYAKQTLKQLSSTLTAEFGKGFDRTNLRKMCALYLCFPIRDALRLELSWTHYRSLTRIKPPHRQSTCQNRGNLMNNKNDGINANLQKRLPPNALTNVGRALARQIDLRIPNS